MTEAGKSAKAAVERANTGEWFRNFRSPIKHMRLYQYSVLGYTSPKVPFGHAVGPFDARGCQKLPDSEVSSGIIVQLFNVRLYFWLENSITSRAE